MTPIGYDRLDCDVLVLGAGVAGLRAALAAHEAGAKAQVLCKSLLGKAASVLAADGIAAAGDARNDGWRAHFADTVRAAGPRGDWRRAELLAKEAPERALELLAWGMLVERRADGSVALQPGDGHCIPRLCRRGDRIGLEALRALQYRVLSLGIPVRMECSAHRVLAAGEGGYATLALDRPSGRFVVFRSRAVVIATGSASAAWSSDAPADAAGDGLQLALGAGAGSCHLDLPEGGGIETEPASGRTRVPGLFAAGGAAACLHARSLPGNALAAALVFGRRAGLAAAQERSRLGALPHAAIGHAISQASAPLSRTTGDNPHLLLRELRELMAVFSTAPRTQANVANASESVDRLRRRAARAAAPGGPAWNAAWHAALDLDSMLGAAQEVIDCARRPARSYPEMPSGLKRLFSWNRQWLAGTSRSASGEATRRRARSGTTR